MTQQHHLTTFDNPYSPFTQFDDWYNFDTSHQYNTLSLLARIWSGSHDVSEVDEDLFIEQAIDEIVRENVSGMHRKVSRDTETGKEFVSVVSHDDPGR